MRNTHQQKSYDQQRLKRILAMKKQHLLEIEARGDREGYDRLEYEIWSLEAHIDS